MPHFNPPSPTYIGPPAHTSTGNNKPVKRIVIHATVSPCKRGGARIIAAYFKTQAAGGSAHYVVDPGEVIQSAYDSVICWHAPPNPNTLGIEMCDMPAMSISRWLSGQPRHGASRNPLRWLEPNHRKMLKRTARLTAELCLAYDVPIRFLSVNEVRDDMHGITTHNNTSQAFHESTHWDPGVWPQKQFMKLVRQYAAEMQKEKAA